MGVYVYFESISMSFHIFNRTERVLFFTFLIPEFLKNLFLHSQRDSSDRIVHSAMLITVAVIFT